MRTMDEEGRPLPSSGFALSWAPGEACVVWWCVVWTWLVRGGPHQRQTEGGVSLETAGGAGRGCIDSHGGCRAGTGQA